MSNSRYASELARIAALPDQQIDLGYTALLIAAAEYPDLDIKSYIKRLDMLASGVAERMPTGASPKTQIAVMNNFLFQERRFRGNSENYYDARNSYLNEVLDRRVGIPITLSVVYIELARRLHIPISGVGMPGHFVVRYDQSGTDLFIDPFHGGKILSSDDCHEMVLKMLGGSCASFGHFLQPISHRAILIRMLTNLKVIYFHQSDADRAIRVLDQIILLNPKTVEEYKERGLLHFSAQRYHAALMDLTAYIEACPDASDAEMIHQRLDMIWAVIDTHF